MSLISIGGLIISTLIQITFSNQFYVQGYVCTHTGLEQCPVDSTGGVQLSIIFTIPIGIEFFQR